MEEILGRAQSLGLKFQEEEKDLNRLSELHELVHDAERQRDYLDNEGEDTTLQDRIIAKAWEEIRVLSKKLR